MNPSLAEGLRALREAADQASSIRIDLDDEYLRAIAKAENLSQNWPGTDKSWVSRLLGWSARHFAGAVQVR